VPYKAGDESAKFVFFSTKQGIIKRTQVSEFENINRNGKIAITLNEGDELAFVKGTSGHDEIILAATNGKAIRFEEDSVRPLGRTARGVRGFNTDGGDVIGMATSEEGSQILTVTELGYGKKSSLADFRMTNRGAKGVKALTVSEKTGNLVCMRAVHGDEDCMIITDDGIVIRISLTQVSEYSRNAQGVRLINVAEGSKVSTVAIVDPAEEESTDLPEATALPAADEDAETETPEENSEENQEGQGEEK
jgi:DNA gyrase subunit A